MDERLGAAAMELFSPALTSEADWVLALELTGTGAGVEDEVTRTTASRELVWSRPAAERGAAFWHAAARAALSGSTFRLGVFADGWTR